MPDANPSPPEAGDGTPDPPAPRTGVWRRTVSRIGADNLTDAAAALTYYSVLSIFPGLLVVAAGLGLLGTSAPRRLLSDLTVVAPGPVREILTGAVTGLASSPGTAGVMAIAGLLGALWAASGYVGAFMRASNMVYGVSEDRPLWKALPIRLAITLAVGTLLAASAVIVVFTGRLAESVGGLLGAGPAAMETWQLAKWPVLVLLVALVFTILYWAGPSTAVGGVFRQVPGGLLAVALWLVASAGFAIYVANFASYDKTYGTLGGVIVFFIWLWVSNLAVLIGAEFNAERLRGRERTERPA